MRFEQPKHLTVALRAKFVVGMRRILIVVSVILNALVLMKLWRLQEAGQTIPTLHWVFAGGLGMIVFILFYGGIYASFSESKFVEFQTDKLCLAKRRRIALKRVLAWPLTPNPILPNCTTLVVDCKFGLGRLRWSMLLDDQSQIAQLKQALEIAFPLKGSPR